MSNEVSYQDVNDYYNNIYYKDPGGGRPEWHYKLYLKYLNIDSSFAGKKILDIACGTCHLLSQARELGLKCSGIDISEKALAFAREKYPAFDLHCGIAEELPWPSDSFDFITCLGALEHFLDQQKALFEMIRVAKSNAKFLIMVPNKDYPNFEGTDQQRIKETLLSLDDWKTMLEKAGLSVQNIAADKWPLTWIPVPKKNPIKLISGLLKRYKIWSLPLKKSYQFIFIANKR